MKLLVFSAHCADFTTRAGGTVAKCVRDGGEVHVIALSNGERSESGTLYTTRPDISLANIRVMRKEDGKAAAAILGATIDFFDIEDLSFDYSAGLAKRLAQEIRAYQPDAILTHHGPDPLSIDHHTTWQLATRAAQMARAPGLESDHPTAKRSPIFLFEATVPLTEAEGFNPEVYVDITSVWDMKSEAIEKFAGAQAHLPGWYKHMALHRAMQARALTGRSEIEYAEAFERTAPWVGNELPLDGV